jgi:putative FmdB family regulatory protein
MPIYAYKCESCGYAKDILQKISDPLLTECPACGAHAFHKQVTAAGFQLKGTGWYVTDFRGGSGGGGGGSAKASSDASSDGAASSTSSDSGGSSPAPGACGGSCACH